MRLKNLSLRNMRLFGTDEQSIAFATDRNVTVLVGNNGCGKSTILDAVAIQISNFTANFKGQSAKQYTDSDVHFDEQEIYGDFLRVSATFATTYNGDLEVIRCRQGRESAPEGVLKNVKSYAEMLVDMVNDGSDCNLPIVAYYGTGRGQIKPPVRKRDFQKAFSRWDAYSGALEADTNFKRFIEWFDLMEDTERREREERWEKGYRNKSLQAVRTALEKFVGGRFSNPRMELSPLRFVMDEKLPGGKTRQVRIEQMSDGYKIVTAMVADIASRMAEANPHMENPLESSGIVLIDEIDLHLHPKWQRTIVGNLVKTFPKIQFIVSTHSPILIAGAQEYAQLLVLENRTVRDVTGTDFSTYDISQLLLSDLFGLESPRSPEWDEALKRHKDLLMNSKRTADETKELKELDDKLSVLSYGDTLEQVESRKLILALAEKLGVKNE